MKLNKVHVSLLSLLFIASLPAMAGMKESRGRSRVVDCFSAETFHGGCFMPIFPSSTDVIAATDLDPESPEFQAELQNEIANGGGPLIDKLAKQNGLTTEEMLNSLRTEQEGQ